MDLGIPTVSVDRAVGHLVQSLSLDIDELALYYQSIDFENKPLLSDLHIHFSALSVEDRETYTTGSIAFDGTRHERGNVTPELRPKTTLPTIVVYIGSAIRSERKIDKEISEAITHELGHYAFGDIAEDPYVEYEKQSDEVSARSVESRSTNIVAMDLRDKPKRLDVLVVNDESIVSRLISACRHRKLSTEVVAG